MKLSQVIVDQSTLQANVVNALSGSDTFKAAFPGETGRLLVDIATSLTTLLLYRIDGAVLNNFLSTAFSRTAAFASATSLGVNPRGRSAATVTLRITPNPGAGPTPIPAYTEFAGRSATWHTRQAYAYLPTMPYLDIDVFQGKLTSATFTGNGLTYQRYAVDSNDIIEDGSITVTVDNTQWTNEPTGSLVLAGDSNTFITKVSPDGTVNVLFGNGVCGRIPASGSVIVASYYTTDGDKYNSNIVNDSFSPKSDFPLSVKSIKAISASSGGIPEESLASLQITAPRLFAANQQAVRRQDYVGWLLRYPGVVSARVWGEYEEAVDKGYADVTMMNRAYYSVLLDSVANITGVKIGTAQSAVSTYSLSLDPDINIVPGSLEILFGYDTFYDSRGQGLLASDVSTSNAAQGGTPSANSVGVNSDSSFCWENITETAYFEAARAPTVQSPVSLFYRFTGPVTPAAIRFQAVGSDIPDFRAAPARIQVYGSSNFTGFGPTTWTPIGTYTDVPDPGRFRYTPWIPLPNTTPVTSIEIDILAAYGSANTVRIQNIEVADLSSLGTIDYAGNAITLNTLGGYDGDITASYVVPSLSPDEVTEISAYLKPKMHFTTQLSFRPPIAQPVDVEADVYLLPSIDPGVATAAIQNALQADFTLGPNSLGQAFYVSDVYRIILGVQGVDYAVVKNPTFDSVPARDAFLMMRDISINCYLSLRVVGAANQ